MINPNAKLFFDGDGLSFDFDKEKKSFISHMDMLKGQSVEEHTLYKKWKELSSYYNTTGDLEKSSITETRIWKPTDISNKDLTIQEISSIDPEIIIVDPESSYADDWKYLRVMCSTFEYSSNKGRIVKLLIRDKLTKKYFGLSSISSDMTSIAVRDKWIGWNKDNKFNQGKLNSICVGSSIIPTQPFGFNFLGGKLVASLLTTPEIRQYWKEKFGDVLVGITTTSLYGSHSMYQRIPYWKELGKSAGKMSLKPDDENYNVWIDYLKEHHKDTYDELMERTGPKQQVLNYIYKLLQIKNTTYLHGFERGVYFCEFYKNSREFLRNEIEEKDLVLHDRLQGGVAGVMEWWKGKAITRYNNLVAQDRVNDKTLFYRKLTQMTWEETKTLYLQDVGR